MGNLPGLHRDDFFHLIWSVLSTLHSSFQTHYRIRRICPRYYYHPFVCVLQSCEQDYQFGPCGDQWCCLLRMVPIGSTGPCITNVIATRRKNFSQWESSFLWKLRCHWLKFLRRVAKTFVLWKRQIPWQGRRTLVDNVMRSVYRFRQCCCSCKRCRLPTVHTHTCIDEATGAG